MGWKWFFQPPGHALLCKDTEQKSLVYWEKSCWGTESPGLERTQFAGVSLFPVWEIGEIAGKLSASQGTDAFL